MSTENPYQPPTDIERVSAPESEPKPVGQHALSEDAQGNLSLTGTLTRVASIITVLGSLNEAWYVWRSLRAGSFSDSFGVWHMFTVVNVLLSASLLFVAWMLWKYSNSLERWRRSGPQDTEEAVEQQAKLWLAIVLAMFFVLLRGIMYLRAV